MSLFCLLCLFRSKIKHCDFMFFYPNGALPPPPSFQIKVEQKTCEIVIASLIIRLSLETQHFWWSVVLGLEWQCKINCIISLQTTVQCHPMCIVLVVFICTTWEICFTFSKQIDIVFTKCEAYLPCDTNENNQDNTHGMALYCSLLTYCTEAKA